MKKNKQKKRKKGKYLFLFLFLLFFAASSAFIVLKVFVVKNIEVTGNELYGDEQIRDWLLDDEYSWNTLYVYLKYRFMKPQEIPFIDTMEVGMKPPHTITVRVYEKGLLGYLYMDSIGQNVYFDKDGIVAETSSETIEGVPKVTGLSCSQVVLYEKINFDDKNALGTLLTVTQTLKKYGLVPDTVAYGKGGTVMLSYGEITVRLGTTDNITEKVRRMEKIMPKLQGKKGTLYLENWSEETTDIIFQQTT